MFSSVLLSFAASALVSAYPHVTKRAGTAAPAVGSDFPDPSIISVGNSLYSFATSGNGVNIQLSVATSVPGQFNLWANYDVLPTLPSWADAAQPDVWAPDVVQVVSVP
jgi:hypothetical protein